MLIDESGFLLQPLTRRTWAPCGKTPVLAAWDRHDRITAITALTLTPHRRRCDLYFKLLPHNAKAEDFFWFLLELRREIKRPLEIVWDRLSAHRKAERIGRQLDLRWLDFHYFPAYCPELNPVEHVWATTKWSRLANYVPANVTELHQRVQAALEQHSRNPQALKAHFQWAELDLT